MKEFKRLNLPDSDLNRVQDNVEEVLKSLRTPFTDSILLKEVSLLTGDNFIPHQLGRALQGWVMVGRSSAALVFDKQITNVLKNKFLILNASAPIIVSLVVF